MVFQVVIKNSTFQNQVKCRASLQLHGNALIATIEFASNLQRPCVCKLSGKYLFAVMKKLSCANSDGCVIAETKARTNRGFARKRATFSGSGIAQSELLFRWVLLRREKNSYKKHLGFRSLSSNHSDVRVNIGCQVSCSHFLNEAIFFNTEREIVPSFILPPTNFFYLNISDAIYQ